VVVLDDWTIGLGQTPEDLLAGPRSGGSQIGMSGMQHIGGGMTEMGDFGDVSYPAYLMVDAGQATDAVCCGAAGDTFEQPGASCTSP
jgi:hypothetical protein